MNASEIAAVIKEKYTELGMSQKDFCELAGIERQTLHYWGKNRSFPTIESLYKINAVLGTHFRVTNENPAPSDGDGRYSEWVTAWDKASPEVREAALAVLRLAAQPPAHQGTPGS